MSKTNPFDKPNPSSKEALTEEHLTEEEICDKVLHLPYIEEDAKCQKRGTEFDTHNHPKRGGKIIIPYDEERKNREHRIMLEAIRKVRASERAKTAEEIFKELEKVLDSRLSFLEEGKEEQITNLANEHKAKGEEEPTEEFEEELDEVQDDWNPPINEITKTKEQIQSLRSRFEKPLSEKDASSRKPIKCAVCEVEFDLYVAEWCSHKPTHTKLCPNGHCICDRLNKGNWQPANEEDRKHGIEMTYHGSEPSGRKPAENGDVK